MSLPVMTELEAVNDMLLLVGEQPVATLDDSLVAYASLARKELTKVTLELCSKGYWFNRRKYTLIPDAAKHIYVPNNSISAKATDTTLIVRIETPTFKLYNVTDNTDLFTDPLEVTLVEYIAYDLLPMSARVFAGISAARRFQVKTQSDTVKMNYTQEEELKAYAEIEAEEMRNSSDTIFDNARSQGHLNRNTNPMGGLLRV